MLLRITIQKLKSFRQATIIASFILLLPSMVYYVRNTNANQIWIIKHFRPIHLNDEIIPGSNFDSLNASSTIESENTCVQPKFELWSEKFAKHYEKLDPLICNQSEKNWVYTENGSFFISSDMAKLHGGNIECDVTPIYRLNDDENTEPGQTIKNANNVSILKSDIIEVNCTARDGNKTSMVLVGVVPKAKIKLRAGFSKKYNSSLDVDIFMLGFDSVSSLDWQRRLPKTYEYLKYTLGGVVLEGYNIVGEGTTQALTPILTGKAEEELPESRRGFKGAKQLDEYPYPFIWGDLKALGYVTQWGEDWSHLGTFTMRQKGFKKAPVDHYMRTYYLKAEKLYGKYQNFCFGSVSRYKIMLDYMKDFCNVYSTQRKFSFIFHNDYSHSNESKLQYAEQELLEHLQYLKAAGHLDNAILILMSDHGLRYQIYRSSEQGKYEERMPFFSIRLPKKIITKYPQIAKNLKINAHRLTTPFDIHATLKDILNFKVGESKLSEDPAKPLPRGISLFREIPRRRSCADAGIRAHWCTCLTWVAVPLNNSMVVPAAQAAVNKINDITSSKRDLCHELQIAWIISSMRYGSSDSLLKYKKSTDWYLRSPVFSDNMTATIFFYQVTFITKPGDGKFQATVSHYIDSGNLTVDDKSISRINRYGDQPHCVVKTAPHMRPYCLCNN